MSFAETAAPSSVRLPLPDAGSVTILTLASASPSVSEYPKSPALNA